MLLVSNGFRFAHLREFCALNAPVVDLYSTIEQDGEVKMCLPLNEWRNVFFFLLHDQSPPKARRALCDHRNACR